MMIKKFRFRGRLKQLGTSVVACVLACVLNAQPTPQVETGDDFTIVLDAGGNLYSFGSNESGQLGVEGAPSPSPNPLLIEPSGGWEQVAVSRGPEPHVLAIRNGALWAWGSNDRGQLGDGTQENSDVPVQISLETNWVEVAVGEDFSMARNELGLVYLWGDNTYGQLGFGPVYNDPAIDIVTTVPNTPLDLNSYIAISAGKAHAHAIRSDGTLWAWGIGNVPTGGNELGILVGGAINLPVGPVLPTQVGAGSGWTDLFSGYETTYALRNSDTETGQLWAWGGGGIMGNGSTNEVYNVPTRINGFGAETGSGWASISRSGNHTIGLKSDGSAYGWGSNYTGGVFSGELGLPIFDNQGQIIFENLTRVRPTRLEAPTTFVAVGAGEGFSAMLNSDGFLISAGINEGGQLGNGSIDESPEDGQDFFANSNLGTADLTITSVIVTTAVIDLAEPLNATVTVRNVGSGTVDDDIELAAVLSPTSNFDDLSAIPLTITNGQPITDDLAAGASIATNLEIDLPAVVNAGTYFLVVRVDPNNAIEETIEDNNDSADLSDGDDDGDEPDGLLFAADLQIVSSDIVVTPVGGPFPLTAGDSINIQVTITNEDIGTVPADPDGSFALRYVLSQVADIEHSSVINLLVDDLLTPDTDESLVLVTEEVPAGGSIVQNIEFVLPDALGVGDFYAGLIVDVNEEVEESDEDNNIAFTETALIEVDGIELGEALDNFDLDFVPEGDGIWYGSEAPIFGPGGEHAAVDDDAAVSPPIAGGQSAYISTTLEETSLISFRWKANTSSPDNKLIFRYLGAEVGSADNEISGISADWVDVQRIAPAGVQIIWQYTQGTDASGDEVYLDNVQITPIADDPDFIVDDVELVEDLEGNSGSYVLDRDKLNLAFFVRNQAADYFPVLDGDMDVRVYLSLDGVFNPATDVLVDTYVYTVGEPILGGETSPNQPSIDLPTSLAPGDYRLIIVVDEDEAIDEILEDNNIYISEEPVVEIIALPDFTIVDMNPEPGFFLVGDQLDFELTLQNDGLQPEFDPITVRIVFSTDNIFDENDYVFGDFSYEGGLAAGGEIGSMNTYSPSIAEVRADVTPIADFLYFGVIIDPDDEHPELDEDDNAVFYSLADFIFGQVSLDEAMEFDELGLSANNKETPSFFGEDNKLNKPFVGQTVESASGPGGDAAQSSDITHDEAATFSVNFQSDTDTIISFDWRTSSEFEVVDDGIKADWLIVYVDDAEVGRIAGELEWAKFTHRVTAGSHTVRWEYQKDGSTDGGEDTAWVDNFQYRLPDLEISNIVLAAQSVNPGDILNFSFVVTNVGSDPVPATPSYGVDARLSSDNQWGDGDVTLEITPAPLNNGELASGASVGYNGSIVVPSGFAEEGDFFFGLRVDPDPDTADEALNGDGLVLETDEANNTIFTDTALITVIPPVTLNEALDIDTLIPEPVLTNGGDAAWFGLDGVDVSDLPPGAADDDIARSGSLELGETSYFETQITGPKVLKYRWKVDSAASNTLEVAVSGDVAESISGRVDWDFGFGPFTISYDSETTVPLRSEAPANEVEDALNALTSISDAGGVTVTGPTLIAVVNRFIYEIEFVANGDQQGQMIFNSLDENRIASSSLSTSQNGSAGVQEARRLTIEPNVSFTLTYEGETTDPIPYYASASDVQTALNALSTIAADGNVTVSDHPEAESALDFLVTFNVNGERELITVNAAGLRQPVTIEADLNSDRFKPGGSDGVAGDAGTAQVQPLRIGPEITVFVPAGAGAQTVRWTFSKNSAAGDFQDAGWLDQLRILDFAEPELVLTELNYVAGTYVLDVSAISGAPDQKLGTSTLDITIQAQNQGEDLDPAVGAFTSADLEVRLSTDRIYGNVDDILLGSFAQVEGTLDRGEILSFLGGLPLGDHIPEDDYYLIAKIDTNERVDEFSKANNIVISQNRDVRIERKPRLLIYDGLNDPNAISSTEAFYVDVVTYDEPLLYYPEAPMRLQMEIQNIGLDDLFDENGQVLNWRVNYRLAFVDREELDNLLMDAFTTEDFDGTVTGFIDLGSTTIAQAMEGRRLASPDGDILLLDIEYALPSAGRMIQVAADDKGINDYIYYIQVIVDADDTVDESGAVNVWNNVDLISMMNTDSPISDVDDGLFTISTSFTSTKVLWQAEYGVDPDSSAEALLSYAFNRNPTSGDTAGSRFPGTYGIDTVDNEEYMTATFDFVRVASDITYTVEASTTLGGAAISELVIDPPYSDLVDSASLTGEGGLIDQSGTGAPDTIEVLSVVDEGYTARITVRYPTPIEDAATGFFRIVVESENVDVPNPAPPAP